MRPPEAESPLAVVQSLILLDVKTSARHSRGLRNSHILSCDSAGISERLGSLPDGGSGSKGRTWRLLPRAPHVLLVTGQPAGAREERVKGAVFGEKAARSLKHVKIS
ncbi:unnamed protein product [Rangifer tarandus platyrhynchus]|uniref:Uncharacterized protein n=1 Tax=Rangifer tarandus platyrhynchus TaxID=3082113 RepID=A0AC59Z693_RANTA